MVSRRSDGWPAKQYLQTRGAALRGFLFRRRGRTESAARALITSADQVSIGFAADISAAWRIPVRERF